jgi:hypothetical protein
MFNAPNDGELVKPKDIVGHLLICRALGTVQGINVNGTLKDGIRLDLVILTTPGADGQPGKTFRDITWINSKLIGSLKNSIGTMVLARMGIGQAKPGQSVPFVLDDATQDAQAVAAAEDFMRRHPEFNEATPVSQAPAPVAQSAPAAYPAPAPGGYPMPGMALPGPQPVQGYPVAQPAQQYAPGFAPQQPFPVAQPVPVQQSLPVAQPAAYPAPAPVAPISVMAPAQPAPAPAAVAPVAQPVPQIIAGSVWDQLPAEQQAAMAQQGYTRGA